jgi:hypothetical protein
VSCIEAELLTRSALQLDESNQLDLEERLNTIRADLHPGQLAFVDDAATQIIGISAGYGAGKTRALCAKAVMLAAANQGFIGAVMEPTGPLIRDIWQNDFENFLEAYEIPYTFRASPLPEYMLHLPGGDTKILCRSFENWSRIIGLNLAWVLADEIDTVTPSIANKAFPKISVACVLVTCGSLVLPAHQKASAGCGTPLAVRKRKDARTAS